MKYTLLGLIAAIVASACVVVQERPADGTPPPQAAPAPATAAPATTSPAPGQKPVVRAPVLPGVLPAGDAGVAADAQ